MARDTSTDQRCVTLYESEGHHVGPGRHDARRGVLRRGLQQAREQAGVRPAPRRERSRLVDQRRLVAVRAKVRREGGDTEVLEPRADEGHAHGFITAYPCART